MSVSAGFQTVIKYPIILMLPIVVQVLISFLLGFKILFGVDFLPFVSLVNGQETDELFHVALPMMVPFVEDMNQSLSFLPALGSGNVFLTVLSFIVYIVIMSFTIAMYLGSIKKVLVSGDKDATSPLQSGIYYFKRIFLFWLFFYLLLLVTFYLLIVFWPLGLLGFFLFMIFTLTPYIIVLDDVSLETALKASPTLLKRHFKQFLPLTMAAFLSTGILSVLMHSFHESLTYYVMLVVYTFIGSGFIAAFMHRLYQCMHTEEAQEEIWASFRYPLWKKIMLMIIIFAAPLLGIYFAGGEHVTGIAAKDNTSLTTGITFQSNWSDAHYGSDRSLTTYGFEQNDKLELSMTLSDDDGSASGDSLFGKGHLTWKVLKELVTQNGNTTTYSGEDVFEDEDFVYRLVPSGDDNNRYYTSLNGGFTKLLGGNQAAYPINMEMFVMNEGKDVFVYQFNEQYDWKSVMQSGLTGEYFLPETSEVNPDEFKYFWYSQEPMTKERILDFLHAKNKEIDPLVVDPAYLDFEIVAASLLQEADGETLVHFAEEAKKNDVTENITDKTADEWSELVERLYGDVDLSTFLAYVNKTNEQDAYEIHTKESDQGTTYHITVPFPEGDIIIHSVWEEDKLVNLEMEVPEEVE